MNGLKDMKAASFARERHWEESSLDPSKLEKQLCATLALNHEANGVGRGARGRRRIREWLRDSEGFMRSDMCAGMVVLDSFMNLHGFPVCLA